MFKKGDMVWHFSLGWGEVIHDSTDMSSHSLVYPVKVIFHNGGYASFTNDGIAYKGEPQTLFHDEVLEALFSSTVIKLREVNMFKKGDMVWEFGRGWGEVVNDKADSTYPIKVSFTMGDYATFTREGRCYIGQPQTLFHDKLKLIEIPPEPQKTAKPDTNLKLETVGGQKVRIYATNDEGDHPIHGAIFTNGIWMSVSWALDGKCSISYPYASLDLASTAAKFSNG